MIREPPAILVVRWHFASKQEWRVPRGALRELK
jgi:hypothetical protein